MREPSLMATTSNKYKLRGVTDLVCGFLLDGSVNRVPVLCTFAFYMGMHA